MTDNQNNEGPRKDAPGNTLKNTAKCACSGGAGLLAGHMGCVITPLALAAMGVTGVVATSPLVMVGAGAAITAASLGLWYGLRGRFAAALERRIVVGSAVAGFALMSAFNMAGGHDHSQHQSPGHGHHHGPHQTNDEAPTVEAQIWFNRLSKAERQTVRDAAAASGMGLGKYVNSLCLSPSPAPENRFK